MEQDNIMNYGMFSPKIENSRHLRLNKNKKNSDNYSKFSYTYINSPINLYSYPKNISNNNKFFSPNYTKVTSLISPINRTNIKLRKSSSQKSINTRPLSCTSRGLPSVINNSFANSLSNRNNSSKKIIYSNLNDNFKTKQKFFNLETEKLYQETYQIKKLVKILSKELSSLKQENAEKDKMISIKEKQINDIITNNNNLHTFENAKDDTNTNEANPSYYFDNINWINSNNSSIFNDSIYTNALISNWNSSMGVLYFKIKKEIKKTNSEIKLENEKYEKLKHSIYNTKVNELKIESNLLEDEINKINSLINNALQTKEKNELQLNEIGDMQESISKQEKIIINIKALVDKLTNKENELNIKLKENKNELNIKLKKVNKNNSKLDILKKKNDNLSNETILNDIKYTTKIGGNLITITSLYKNKINELKKNIKFYKKQLLYSDNEINKLKEKRKKLIDTGKIKSIKYDANFLDKKNNNINIKINTNNEKRMSAGGTMKIPDEEIISKLKNKLKKSKEDEKKLEEKIFLYQNKLKEIDVNQEGEKEEVDETQIEFGIDSENPYYIEDDNNIPENTNKFTSSQFNQFTYILFKNFESKGIVQDASKNKLINPLIEFANNNNISIVEYPSNNFDMVISEFTNIILNTLNINNTSNQIITKIFISALFYNSGCNVKKFIEYFNILFSYTRDYSSEEEKYINKLKDKYKEQTTKLISCINNYIKDELNSSPYFPLLKVKELLDKNEINLKDKYIEFLFYYMKKFDDPQSKLSDLKFSLLRDIIPSNSNVNENEIIEKLEIKENVENLEKSNNSNLNFKENDIIEQNEILKEENNKIDLSQKKESNLMEEIDNKNSLNENISNNNDISSAKKSPTEEDFSNRQKMKHHTDKNDKDNSDDFDEDDEDSMTEITNEEYVKQLTEAINIMQKGLIENNINFDDLMTNVVQKRKINGVFYECITIEDFNDQLKSIKIVLSDLKLSCLCSKYSIPNELRLIDKNKIEKDIEKQSKGKLKFDEEDDEH